MATPATRPRIERWAWIGIYGGLALAALGIALVRNGDVALGWGFLAAGTLAVAAGIVLVWVRSRMPDPSPLSSGDPP